MSDPQIVCQGQQCTTLPIPPFVPAPQPAPKNVLVIPRQTPPPNQFCDQQLSQAITNYENLPARCASPSHLAIFDCGATVEGCDLDSIGFGGGKCSATACGPGGCGAKVFDSNPSWDDDVAHGRICDNLGTLTIETEPVVVTPPLPPPPPGFCTSPCVLQVNSDGSESCVCDPPIPSSVPTELRAFVPRVARAIRAKPILKTALNPTLRAGKPFVFKYCGCNEQPDFEESVT